MRSNCELFSLFNILLVYIHGLLYNYLFLNRSFFGDNRSSFGSYLSFKNMLCSSANNSIVLLSLCKKKQK